MRLIQYPMTLRNGYCLFNCPEANNSEDYGDVLGPGIHMKIIKDAAEQSIIDRFEFVTDRGNPNFEEHFRQTLRGEETLWKIVRVVINCWSINLQFASEHFCHEQARLRAESDAGRMNDDERRAFWASTEDTDEIRLDVNSLRATLQFEVPRFGTSGVDVIEVECRERYGVMVTENDGNKKRRFEIHPPLVKGEIDNFYAIVTECMA